MSGVSPLAVCLMNVEIPLAVELMTGGHQLSFTAEGMPLAVPREERWTLLAAGQCCWQRLKYRMFSGGLPAVQMTTSAPESLIIIISREPAWTLRNYFCT